jgi:hypothetical protein
VLTFPFLGLGACFLAYDDRLIVIFIPEAGAAKPQLSMVAFDHLSVREPHGVACI